MGVEQEKLVTPRRFKHLKYFLAVLALALLLVSLSYGSITYASFNKSLPRLKMGNQDVGKKTSDQLFSQVYALKGGQEDNKVTITAGDQSVTKTYSEIGLKIDQDATAQKILDYGKYRGQFPSFSYLIQTVQGTLNVAPAITWEGNPEDNLNKLLPATKSLPENPKIKFENGAVSFEKEKEGWEINLPELKDQIEKSFLSQENSAQISASKKPVKSNLATADLEPYKDQVASFLNLAPSLSYEWKKFKPDTEELIGWIDSEATVREKKLSFSDQAIKNYLEGTIAPKVNARKTPRKISSYDGSVISEGRAGLEVKVDPTLAAIKKALSESQDKIELVVDMSDIEEETVDPGFTPGKYAGKYIEINLSEQKLYQFEGSTMVGAHSVSTGKWSMPTPIGEFAINSKTERAYSQRYELYMPWWMSFIGSDYGIHELPEWPGGAKEGESHLGTPVSHGCVRLGVGDAEAVYNWAEIGTPVYVHR